MKRLIFISLLFCISILGISQNSFYNTHSSWEGYEVNSDLIFYTYTLPGQSTVAFTATLAEAQSACHICTDNPSGISMDGKCITPKSPKVGTTCYYAPSDCVTSNEVLVDTGYYLISYEFSSRIRFRILYISNGVVQSIINCS